MKQLFISPEKIKKIARILNLKNLTKSDFTWAHQLCNKGTISTKEFLVETLQKWNEE